ncbi:RDD family protein [Sulfurimonas sp. HSL3-7]|uniref:RDD family protein n=1 Tax=Sulfonitrofixus jiaomeiensis TaxID=3131938 RepID=UPI0031F96BB1
MRWRDIKQKKNISTPPQKPKVQYAGFWSRTLAFITDVFMIGIPITIIIMIFFGYEQTQTAGFTDAVMQTQKAQEHAPNPLASVVQLLLFMASFVFLWKLAGQTPGMKIAHIEIVDASSFKRPSYLQLVTRFFSYIFSIFFFGYLWGLFRKDKRMLHDLISRTAIIYKTA